MFDRRRSFWNSLLLHAALLAGSILFALPYLWLLGTSWKLEKEVQSDKIRIFPRRPVPAVASPYIDSQQFPEIERPEQVATDRWDGWMNAYLQDRIGQAIAAWKDPRSESLPRDTLRQELAQGVFRRLLNLVPYDAWQDGERAAFSAAVDKVLTAEVVQGAFDQAYRYFALGTLRLVTQDYRVINLIDKQQADHAWKAGPNDEVSLSPQHEPGRTYSAVHYKLQPLQSPEFTVQLADVPIDLTDPQHGFKRLELSYRSDGSWHDLRCEVQMNGWTYVSESPKYLGNNQWAEVHFQLPGKDDERLIPKRYIRLQPHGDSAITAPGTLAVTLTLNQSSRAEAYWAKGTENYRTAFAEVPFWRYFKTSAFLVAANIIGTLLSCSLVAYAFGRLNWPGRDLCFILVLATLMIPPQITMIPSFVIYKYLGWYNTLAPLWLPSFLAVNGFGIFLLRQAFKGIPKDLEEAAKIDGAGHLRIYWHIMLPLVRPTLAAIAIFTFMFVWNDFLGPLIYVNDQRLYPLALGLFSFMAGRENQFTLIMAGSMIMTLPVIITFFFAQRYFIQGVSMTGMKT